MGGEIYASAETLVRKSKSTITWSSWRTAWGW